MHSSYVDLDGLFQRESHIAKWALDAFFYSVMGCHVIFKMMSPIEGFFAQMALKQGIFIFEMRSLVGS